MPELVPGKILVVDDDPYIILSLQTLLEQHFTQIVTLKDPGGIPSRLTEEDYDVVLLDMNFKQGDTSGSEGMNWLQRIIELDDSISVIMITAYGGVNIAVSAIQKGAADFIVKPWQNEKMVSTVSAACKLTRSRRKVKRLNSQKKMLSSIIEDQFSGILGESGAIRYLMEDIHKVAGTDANVLIQGDNGTGKELVAREIHRKSMRSSEVFIAVDLGSIAENLFESELFGHTRGAFTDAREERTGRFEAASGGTLFLDEIGNLSLSLQAKILSALESRKIYRLGSNKPVHIDIRLISASNQALLQMVANGLFRQDLLYRLNTVEITVPTLRDRREDIPLLSEHFLQRYSRKYRKEGLKLPENIAKKLQKYDWPGNVRELQHAVERAVIMSDGRLLRPDDFQLSSAEETAGEAELDFNLEKIEKKAISQCLKKHGGNVSRAAEELGLTRGALYRRIEKYGF